MTAEPRRFELIFNEQCAEEFKERYLIDVWCEGREYDPDFESYRPVYSYKIIKLTGLNDWEYTANDLKGACGEVPDLNKASQSLFAFLIACQEGLPEDTNGACENASLFPDYVREFAYLLKEELSMKYYELEQENA